DPRDERPIRALARRKPFALAHEILGEPLFRIRAAEPLHRDPPAAQHHALHHVVGVPIEVDLRRLDVPKQTANLGRHLPPSHPLTPPPPPPPAAPPPPPPAPPPAPASAPAPAAAAAAVPASASAPASAPAPAPASASAPAPAPASAPA